MCAPLVLQAEAVLNARTIGTRANSATCVRPDMKAQIAGTAWTSATRVTTAMNALTHGSKGPNVTSVSIHAEQARHASDVLRDSRGQTVGNAPISTRARIVSIIDLMA